MDKAELKQAIYEKVGERQLFFTLNTTGDRLETTDIEGLYYAPGWDYYEYLGDPVRESDFVLDCLSTLVGVAEEGDRQ